MDLYNTTKNPKRFSTPILLIVFNRPDTTLEVLKSIRKLKPSKLYISSDGARLDKEDEQKKVMLVRELVTSNINWPCELNTLFHDVNQGCKHGVSSAIDWFFSKEEMGIILEDDCLPNDDFFHFCEEMLIRYSYNNNIFSISGNNFQKEINSNYSYYYSKYIHIWGWATWRRAWLKNDLYISFWPEWKSSNSWHSLFSDNIERVYWENIFDLAYNNKIDTWDYSWIASVWYYNGIAITPNKNLVSNLGFNADATHTKKNDNKFANLPVSRIGKLNFNDTFEVDVKADNYTFNKIFDGYKLRWPFNYFYSFKRLLYKTFLKLF
jgi:hypothetical protein